MRKLRSLLFLLALVPLVVMTACKDEDDPLPVTDDFNTLKTYLISNGLDLPDVLNGWITSAPADIDEVDAWAASYFILDIREATDYRAGHIKGAVNTSLGNILTAADNAGDKPILVVCYTGQSAGHAVVALRLSGYPDAKVLKWGMSGWNNATANPWKDNIGDDAVRSDKWIKPMDITPNQTFEYPSLNTVSSHGPGILAERVEALLTNGFKGVENESVLANPANYFINNYWAESDTDHYGHIEGAFRVNPLSFAAGTFKNINPDKTAVTYCWTGQTSSIVTAYLTVLGYDARSLKFGCNGMIYSELEGHKYSPPSVDLPVVTE